MCSNEQSMCGMQNIGNTCFLNAVLQALASSSAMVEHLHRTSSSAINEDTPLAGAIFECLSALAYRTQPPRNNSISPKPVLDAFRKYIPAECLRDGEQNDSAEVLELLCSTLASEYVNQTSQPSVALQQAQSPWKLLSSLLSASLGDNAQLAANTTAVHNMVRQDVPAKVGKRQASKAASSSSNSQTDMSGPDANAHDMQEGGQWSGSCRKADCGSMPLEGNTVNDMMCVKCQQSFVSQHSPFLLLPLALPTEQVTARHGTVELQRTVVARNASLRRCLADFCGLELVPGVHCPRCTLRAMLRATQDKDSQCISPSTQPSAAVQLEADSSEASHTQRCMEQGAGSGILRASQPAQSATDSSAQSAAEGGVEADDRQSEGAAATAAKSAADRAAAAEPRPAKAVQLGQKRETGGCKPALTDSQLQKRGIIEGLLQGVAPWPDINYEQLATDAGLEWHPVGTPCVKRISLGRVPQAICLHLRRAVWTNTGRHLKLTGHVKFPLTLDLTPYSAANMLPLSGISQRYAATADSARTQWMAQTASDASDVSDYKGKGPGLYGGALGRPDAAVGDAPAGAVRAAAPDGDALTTSGRAAAPDGAALATSGRAAAPDGAALATSGRAASPGGNAPLHSGRATSPVEDARASPSSSSSSSRVATKPAQSATMLGNSTAPLKDGLASASAFAPAAAHNMPDSTFEEHLPEDDHNSPRAGQVTAAGRVQQLIASHALSLTSESSLLDEEVFSKAAGIPMTGDDASSTPTAATAAAAAGDSLARRVATGRAHDVGSKRRAGQLPASGQVQRVLASHALSLASSLMSEGSLREEVELGDATPQHNINTAAVHQQRLQQAEEDVAQGDDDVEDRMTSHSEAIDGPERDLHASSDTQQAADGEMSTSDPATPAADHDDAVARGDAQDATEAPASAGDDSAGDAVDDETLADRWGDKGSPAHGSQPPHGTATSPCPTDPMDDAEEQHSTEAEDDAFLGVHCNSTAVHGKVYHLTAAVVHHGGGSGSGHYTVYRRVQSANNVSTAAKEHAQWFSISDEVVHKADVCDVLACQASLLFYETSA